MNNLKAIVSTAALAVSVATGTAQADFLDFTIDTSAISGSTTNKTFSADEIVWSSQGTSRIDLQDASGDGTLGGIDSFFEMGVVTFASFKNDGLTLVGTGVNNDYQMFADFTLTGYTFLTAGGDLVAKFTGGSGSFWYDEALDSVLNGTETAFATFTPSGLGDCVITAAVPGVFSQGSCKIFFDFEDSGVTDAGAITETSSGVDLGALVNPATMVIDVNVDELNPALTFAYPGGPGSTQTTFITHDGSAFFVPEPGILALFGAGLLGMGAVRRSKKA